jgi:outer membrane receptor protein involved in Fe transport
MKYLFYIFVLIWISFSSNAQAQGSSGRISGRVLAAKTGEYLSSATVKIENTTFLTKTDLDGHFAFSNVPLGTYSLTVSYVSFETKTVTDVVVTTTETSNVNFAMEPPAKSSLDNVIVTAKRSARQETMASLLVTQKNSAVVSDGIPAEMIRRTPDRNTSEVLKRVSGASIQDDKFVIIRGLNDRYNASFLNGAPLPSTEAERKAFSFDIFPSNMLDNLVISKTATPENPSDFAGGIINITTKSVPTKKFAQISGSVGFNTLTTFKNGYGYKGSSTDWLGIDNGMRQMPSTVPPLGQFPTTPQTRAALAKSFDNNWGYNTEKMSPNLGFQYSQGFTLDKKGGGEGLGAIVSLTYNRTVTNSQGELQSIEYDRTNPSGDPIIRGAFNDFSTRVQTLMGAIANFSYKINNFNRISLKNIYSINSDDRTVVRQGQPDKSGDSGTIAIASALWFTSNRIFSSQLQGEHKTSVDGWKINWVLGYSDVHREIPNLRQMNYAKNDGSTDFLAAIPQGTTSNGNAGTMFFSYNDEKIYNGRLDFSKEFDLGKVENIVKFGGYYQNRDREFNARVLGFGRYAVPGGIRFDNSLLKKPENTIFDTANMGVQKNGLGGFLLLDGTKPQDGYTASSDLSAGYLMLDQRYTDKIRAVYGARLESFNQKLYGLRNFGDTIRLNTSKIDINPSVNVIYSVTKTQNVRAAYSRTLNRPEFRELAPFAFFDFTTRYVTQGNDTIQRATIDNFDLRWEMYPGRAQLFSFSAFYKNFTNPIELVSNPSIPAQSRFQNAASAISYGLEAEFRMLLVTLFKNSKSSIWERLTWSANGALIWSEITEISSLGEKVLEDRPLQGQSPYLINSSLMYSDELGKTTATISGNRVGERIYIVGNTSDVDILENGRTIIDMQVTRKMMKNRLELKLNARDILAQDQVFFYDINQDLKHNKKSDIKFQTRNFGPTIALTATLNL